MYPQRNPRKEKHAEVTERQINQIECAFGEELLRVLFESNEQAENQGNSKHEQFPAWMRKRAGKSHVEEQGQNPVEDEVSDFVGEGNLIEHLQKAKFSQIGKDNNENDKEGKEKCEPFHDKKMGGSETRPKH